MIFLRDNTKISIRKVVSNKVNSSFVFFRKEINSLQVRSNLFWEGGTCQKELYPSWWHSPM